MTEQTSTRKNGSEPHTDESDSHQTVRTGPEQASRGGAGSLAVAIDKLVKYLAERERANHRRGDGSRHTVVDIASLKDWLDRLEARSLGVTPRSKPVAQREERSGGETVPRDSKANRQRRSTSASPAARPVPPAKVFRNGDVTTKVWANHRGPGHLTWNVQQFRVYRTAKGLGEARSFRLDDLRDAMRGAYQAERWIRKNERRYRFLGWFLGY